MRWTCSELLLLLNLNFTRIAAPWLQPCEWTKQKPVLWKIVAVIMMTMNMRRLILCRFVRIDSLSIVTIQTVFSLSLFGPQSSPKRKAIFLSLKMMSMMIAKKFASIIKFSKRSRSVMLSSSLDLIMPWKRLMNQTLITSWSWWTYLLLDPMCQPSSVSSNSTPTSVSILSSLSPQWRT